MNWATILKVILFAIALSMDAFAIAITDGLIYKDINKKKGIFIALVFGVMQAIMPLIGYFIVELVTVIVGQNAGTRAGEILSLVIIWIAFALLILVGTKMFIDGIKEIKQKENKKLKDFSVKEVLFYGLLTSIDALAVGISFHAGLSNNVSIWIHVSIILVITFVISLLGVLLGNTFNRLFKGKYQISCIIGGVILIILAIWVVLSHYLGI